MGEFTNHLAGKLEIDHCDVSAADKSSATNGRLFTSMMFVANLAAFYRGNGDVHWYLAILAAIVVGIACLVDRMGDGADRRAASVAISIISIILVIASLLSI